MEVILLERVAKLGQMGEVVRVKDGFARNFLLKRGKALRATTDNRAKFDGMKAELEVRNLQAKGEAIKVAEKIDGRNVVVLRQASETGQLFGSVTVRDIIASFEADGVSIRRSQVMLDAPIKTIGKHKIAIAVHPEVEVGVTVTVARSADEAERINRGEDISTRQEDQDAAAEALAVCFSIPAVTQKTSAATTATCRPGLMTRARQIRRSPVAGDNKFNLYSAVSAGWPRDVAAAIVVALSTRKAVTPPWNKPCCCKSSGRRSTASVHDPRVSSQSSAPTWLMNPWAAMLSRILSAIGAKSESRSAVMTCPRFSKQPPVRPGLGSRRRSECRSDALDRNGRDPTTTRDRRSAPVQ